VATRSTAAMAKLESQARGLFTHLAQSGEGGELLLFAMAEAIFGLSQILCKMSLKTSTSMHYHGADGVYADVRQDGGLNIYWGESKIYSDATTAIRDCLASLAPFLVQPSGEDAIRNQDILLINEFANFTDPQLVEGLRRVLDRDDPASLQTRHCGIALVAFDCGSYPSENAHSTLDAIEAAMREQLPGWSRSVERRVAHEGLDQFDVHFICVPIPSAESFRTYFLKLLGVAG
jgi:Cap4 SAVED domain